MSVSNTELFTKELNEAKKILQIVVEKYQVKEGVTLSLNRGVFNTHIDLELFKTNDN